MVLFNFQDTCCSQNQMFHTALLFKKKKISKLYLYFGGSFHMTILWLPKSSCCLIRAQKDHCEGLFEQSENISHLFFCYLLLRIFFVFLPKKNRQLNAFLESLNKVASAAGKHKISFGSCRFHTSYYGSYWNLAETRVVEHVVRNSIMLALSSLLTNREWLYCLWHQPFRFSVYSLLGQFTDKQMFK